MCVERKEEKGNEQESREQVARQCLHRPYLEQPSTMPATCNRDVAPVVRDWLPARFCIEARGIKKKWWI